MESLHFSMSSYDGHFSIVEVLVQNGADVNQADNLMEELLF